MVADTALHNCTAPAAAEVVQASDYTPDNLDTAANTLDIHCVADTPDTVVEGDNFAEAVDKHQLHHYWEESDEGAVPGRQEALDIVAVVELGTVVCQMLAVLPVVVDWARGCYSWHQLSQVELIERGVLELVRC